MIAIAIPVFFMSRFLQLTLGEFGWFRFRPDRNEPAGVALGRLVAGSPRPGDWTLIFVLTHPSDGVGEWYERRKGKGVLILQKIPERKKNFCLNSDGFGCRWYGAAQYPGRIVLWRSDIFWKYFLKRYCSQGMGAVINQECSECGAAKRPSTGFP
ncbi:hypothetical protein [Denitromonas iodatirespirans]|uniref:Uncharacterized protein n=1 Tax=Denitromonas iodatirespirans TaxID=2795389 RepID=A0A944H8G5_DENI1|nr:hypothetical protein [Denitromonas iodatirespirans]MBT0962184.1 hypothetical protein [Denitromonas iodatirespirans]